MSAVDARTDSRSVRSSKIITGTMKNVAIDQAAPMREVMILPTRRERSAMNLRITPTLAETSAQATIRPRCCVEARNPSATVGSPPSRRIRAQWMIATLKKRTMNQLTKYQTNSAA